MFTINKAFVFPSRFMKILYLDQIKTMSLEVCNKLTYRKFFKKKRRQSSRKEFVQGLES